MSKKQNQKLASMILGPSFMSRVRAVNPKAARLDLRKTLAFPEDRDRLPENPEVDYPSMITGGPIEKIGDKWFGKPVAVIGAGAAGLCAGYELMRCGLTPVFYEFQLDARGANLVRVGGRANSYNFAAAGQPPAFGEKGCMRFPKSHTTLRAYVEQVFKGEYHYAREVDNQWPPFIDPLLFDGSGDIPQNDWKVVYDTAFYARGINKRKYYRVNEGTTFAQLPEAIQDVSVAFGEFLLGESGVLADLVKAYASADFDKIKSIWAALNAQYQDKSIFEVLRDQGWEKVVKGTNDTSRLSIFGELGLGSGGFDAFWGTTFMEILRIKIHEDEVNQDAIVGGCSYMLSPFVRHKVACANGKTQSLKDVCDGKIATQPVTKIKMESGGGVRIFTEGDNVGKLFPCAVLTASPTSISSSIAIDEEIFAPETWNGIRNMPLTGCGKVFTAFPTPFWKKASKQYPGRDAIVTTVTDEALRQIYTFDDYHWGSGSKMGVLMMSYTWGDWAHKMGSLSPGEQVKSTLRMMQEIYADEWRSEWDTLFQDALSAGNYDAINWSHERGYAGGYRMADLNRYKDQQYMSAACAKPDNTQAAVCLAGEAVAWLGLSGWIEGALHTGIDATRGIGIWFEQNANSFGNWDKVIDPSAGAGPGSFASPVAPVDKTDNGGK